MFGKLLAGLAVIFFVFLLRNPHLIQSWINIEPEEHWPNKGRPVTAPPVPGPIERIPPPLVPVPHPSPSSSAETDAAMAKFWRERREAVESREKEAARWEQQRDEETKKYYEKKRQDEIYQKEMYERRQQEKILEERAAERRRQRAIDEQNAEQRRQSNWR